MYLCCTWKKSCALCHVREGRGKANASDFKCLSEEELVDIKLIKLEDVCYTLSYSYLPYPHEVSVKE